MEMESSCSLVPSQRESSVLEEGYEDMDIDQQGTIYPSTLLTQYSVPPNLAFFFDDDVGTMSGTCKDLEGNDMSYRLRRPASDAEVFFFLNYKDQAISSNGIALVYDRISDAVKIDIQVFCDMLQNHFDYLLSQPSFASLVIKPSIPPKKPAANFTYTFFRNKIGAANISLNLEMIVGTRSLI
jgi:hypothetical protein